MPFELKITIGSGTPTTHVDILRTGVAMRYAYADASRTQISITNDDLQADGTNVQVD